MVGVLDYLNLMTLLVLLSVVVLVLVDIHVCIQDILVKKYFSIPVVDIILLEILFTLGVDSFCTDTLNVLKKGCVQLPDKTRLI